MKCKFDECGKEFKKTQPHQDFCSASCRKKKHDKYARAYRLEHKRKSMSNYNPVLDPLLRSKW